MESLLLVAGGGVLVLAVGALFYWVVGPAERARGAEDAAALQRAKAEGLQQGAQVAEKAAEAEVRRAEERAEADHKLDPVDFANALIDKKRKS